MRSFHSITVATILGTASVAVAQPAPSISDQAAEPAGHTVGIAPRVGVTIPTGGLGVMAAVGLEVTIAVAAQKRLGISIDASWSRPGEEGRVSDSRVPSPAMYTIDQDEVVLALMVGYRLARPEKTLVPWVAGGPLVHLLRTKQTTTIAPGENTASATEPGAQVACGVDMKAGPGFLVGDLRFAYSALDNVLTGDSNAGKLMLAAGYRLAF
jgi:hypothetical protein